MRNKAVRVMKIYLIAAFSLCLFVFLELISSNIAHAENSTSSLMPIATPPSTGISGGAIDWGNPTIVGALVALAGVFATVGVYIYQTHLNAKIEREKLEAQHQHEQELAKLRTQHEQDMLHLQIELEQQDKLRERNQQRQETEAEVAYIAMLRAKTLTERVEAYRKALHADPHIAFLQILDMDRPLTVTDLYIPVHLHQETKPGFELDPALQDTKMQRDPNELLKAGLMRHESRASTALDPYKALGEYNRCIIVGDPGAGKTTLLKYLTLQSADHQFPDLPDLPIHIELNALAHPHIGIGGEIR